MKSRGRLAHLVSLPHFCSISRFAHGPSAVAPPPTSHQPFREKEEERHAMIEIASPFKELSCQPYLKVFAKISLELCHMAIPSYKAAWKMCLSYHRHHHQNEGSVIGKRKGWLGGQ
jgi:hypothetical protein